MTEQTMHPIDANSGQGGWFCFVVNGEQVAVRARFWTGLVKVWVDDKLVSTGRRWTRYAEHKFEYNGMQYEIDLSFRPSLSTVSVCTLLRDGREVGRAEQRLVVNRVPRLLIPIVIGFGGVLVGALLTRLIAGV